LIRPYLFDGGSLLYTRTIDGGTCSVLCHGNDHNNVAYHARPY
jgi:hypothetical protein